MTNGNGNGGLPDRAKGWVKRWATRYLIYTGFTWSVSTMVWIPYYMVVIGFSYGQLILYLWTSLPFCLLAYILMAPFGRWCWRTIWRIEHRVYPWWRDARE